MEVHGRWAPGAQAADLRVFAPLPESYAPAKEAPPAARVPQPGAGLSGVATARGPAGRGDPPAAPPSALRPQVRGGAQAPHLGGGRPGGASPERPRAKLPLPSSSRLLPRRPPPSPRRPSFRKRFT